MTRHTKTNEKVKMGRYRARKSLRRAVTRSEADSRQERKQERETEFYDGVVALSACDRRDVSVL